MAGEDADYYAFFDSKTNNGVVFDEDLSKCSILPVTRLTDIEKASRQKWETTRAEIVDHYETKGWIKMENTDDLLKQRILAPCLRAKDASTRSGASETRASRFYPPELSPWAEFSEDVINLKVIRRNLKSPRSSPFQLSAENGDSSIEVRDERQEEIFLINLLNRFCGKHKLLGQLTSRAQTLGRPDVVMKAMSCDDVSGSEDETPAVLCEFKSTHNLPLPMLATEVCETYNQAYKQLYRQNNGRTTGWIRICHPIGQLFGYMVDNSSRYGILSSGTRTFFLRIQKIEGKETVQISDAMFVGQANYMKAWIYISQLHNIGDVLDPEKLGWERITKSESTPPRHSESPPSAEEDGNAERPAKVMRIDTRTETSVAAASGAAEESSVLPYVSFSEIRIIKALGFGRNGTVILAEWKGRKVALKQFDLAKSGLSYYQELKSYTICRKAWGRLVPTPYFVSESWSGGVRFLGLQLGRPPGSGDDISMRQQVLKELEEEFGIRQEDCDGTNMLFIPNGKEERLVAIDLEAVTILHRC